MNFVINESILFFVIIDIVCDPKFGGVIVLSITYVMTNMAKLLLLNVAEQRCFQSNYKLKKFFL